MQTETTSQNISYEICVEKAARVMRWISESEDISKTHFSVTRLFEDGVLQENTRAFLHLLLEEKYPGQRIELELPPDEISSVLTEAFTNVYLYLLTPQRFITDFLSFGSGVIRMNQATLARLSYFVDYSYFQEMIDEWLAIQLQKQHFENSINELKDFLKDVDWAILQHSPLEQITSFLAPLYEYHDKSAIDRNVLMIFLTDKGLILADGIQNNEFQPNEASLAIKEALLISKHPESAFTSQQGPEYSTFLKELREIGVILPTPNGNTVQEKETKKVLPPMQMFVDSHLHKKCLEEIFHLNANEYDRMITMLNSISEYSQAELNLRTLFHMHKVAPHSKVAIRLIEALRLRFGGLSLKNS